ncbi:MAG: ParB/RepB/Spo0J family partition protein [Gammaproteobacteria bacterium]|nr:ParB/RepB/Spo0J family partition protein [Gammaproteobacteria bacterium]
MVKKRGLGKSLDALLIGSFSNSAQSVGNEHAADTLAKLSVDVIQRGKYQPRRGMDPEALEELANSIRAQGIIQPIVVRQIASGRYEIVAGERRWRAAQMAGLTEIPALIRDIPDEAAVAIALIENIQRESLNPIEESMALQRLLEEFSMTHQQVADAVGKSRATVSNLLRLLALNEDVKAMLEIGDLEMGHARALLTLDNKLQLDAAEIIIAKGLSVRETEELVRRMQLPSELVQSMTKPVDPDIKRLQQDLTHRIRLPVVIHCNAKGKGKLVIQYSNITELDKLLEYFQVG